MNKVLFFAAIQVAMYLLVAFVTWDLTWLANAGELSVLNRAFVLFPWLAVSALVIGELNDD